MRRGWLTAMRSRSGMLTFLIVLALSASSCSDAVPLEEYVATMESAADAYITESQDLSYDYQSEIEVGVRTIVEEGGDDPAAQALDLVRSGTVQYLALLLDAMTRYLAELEELDPPDAVSDAHDEYVEATRLIHSAIPAARDSVEQAEGLEDVQLALTGSGYADAQFRWLASCSALEQAVRDQGTGMDIGCERPPEGPTGGATEGGGSP